MGWYVVDGHGHMVHYNGRAARDLDEETARSMAAYLNGRTD
ncbi:hypothetical protein [Streptomyces sp. URMC 129]